MIYIQAMKKMILQVFLLVGVLLTQQVNSQSSNSSLYLQSSELHDLMVQYRSDMGNITRFYATSPSFGFGGGGRGGQQFNTTYNSPERRERMLQLIADYEKKMDAINFDKISIYGKVDYILFKRVVDDAKDALIKEHEAYAKISRLLPFSDNIYNLEKPRRRGLNVNGEAVAKDMNGIRKMVLKAKADLQKEEMMDSKILMNNA